MDAQARKALFRKRLAAKKGKRIDSPLVRYNESDQPVCKVCNLILKSESLWDAHQVSSKHRQAVNNLKSQASGLTKVNNAKAGSHSRSVRAGEPKSGYNPESKDMKIEPATKLSKPQAASGLPPDFFDSNDKKKIQTSAKPLESDYIKKLEHTSQMHLYPEIDMEKLPKGNVGQLEKGPPEIDELVQSSAQITAPESKHTKGSLPEGFFDNKEADLLARGIKPVKPDVKDEYKEFEKLIQEDLQVVDDRLEEEEVWTLSKTMGDTCNIPGRSIGVSAYQKLMFWRVCCQIDVAEMNEETETLEQKTYREKVEILKKRKIELMASRAGKRNKSSLTGGRESSSERSSCDSGDEDFTVDWRAQHL